ncbi:MAG: hypothetical protein FJW23_07010 [Acidimicrobiia bacterium]|nr:hypothetical protein [Acidimicrobiia bacterium]
MRHARRVPGRRAILLAALSALAVFSPSSSRIGAAQQPASDGYSLLRGAIDVHLHIDPDVSETRAVDAIDIARMKFGRAQGLRGFVIKNHYESTAAVAYLVQKELPGADVFGGIVLNRNQGGINLAAVEYMATQIKGKPFRIVWMPTYDSENAVRRSDRPDRPFVRVSQNGQLVPEVREMIGLIAKHDLVLATGHLTPEEGLMVVREGRKQGVKHMIVTHPMDAGVFMTEAQMKEAASLGAFLEFDFRNILTGKIANPFPTAPIAGGRVEMIRKLGPEHVIIDEFWSKSSRAPREYGGPDELAAWVKAMNAQGFSNRELDIMCKENPARLLGLPLLSGE